MPVHLQADSSSSGNKDIDLRTFLSETDSNSSSYKTTLWLSVHICVLCEKGKKQYLGFVAIHHLCFLTSPAENSCLVPAIRGADALTLKICRQR